MVGVGYVSVRSGAISMLLAFAMLLWAGAAAATESASFSVRYEAVKSEDHKRFATLLRSSEGLPAMLSFVDDFIELNSSVELVVGAEEGPYFDPSAQIITLPYEFAEEIETRFLNQDPSLGATRDVLDQTVLDVIMHTVFHELGHALVAQYNIPILAKEEDAVDGLANVMLLDYVENGADIATTAAEMFGLEDMDIEEFESSDFWDEHSLDIQRYYTTYCHIYGSNPEENSDLVDLGILSEDRAEQCVDEYYFLKQSWLQVLEPYLKE